MGTSWGRRLHSVCGFRRQKDRSPVTEMTTTPWKLGILFEFPFRTSPRRVGARGQATTSDQDVRAGADGAAGDRHCRCFARPMPTGVSRPEHGGVSEGSKAPPTRRAAGPSSPASQRSADPLPSETTSIASAASVSQSQTSPGPSLPPPGSSRPSDGLVRFGACLTCSAIQAVPPPMTIPDPPLLLLVGHCHGVLSERQHDAKW
jgi:hypothetical protein